MHDDEKSPELYGTCTGVLFVLGLVLGLHKLYNIHDESSIQRFTWYCTRLKHYNNWPYVDAIKPDRGVLNQSPME